MVHERRRLLPTLLAVLIGVAFLTSTLVLSATIRSSLVASASAQVGDAKVVVTTLHGATIPADAVDAVRRIPGVTSVVAQAATPAFATRANQATGVPQPLTARLAPDALGPGTPFPGSRLVSGHLPHGDGEVAVNTAAADSGVTVGSALRLSDTSGPTSGDATSVKRTVRVVGVVSPGPALSTATAMPEAYVTAPTLAAFSGTTNRDTLRVWGTGSQEALTAAVAKLPALADTGAVVRSGDAQRQHDAETMTHGSQGLTAVFTGFAVIAMAVSVIVITNTFTILVAQRTRSLALSRCIGATRSQVRRSVLSEALLVGLVGSVLGVGVGAGATQGIVSVLRNTVSVPVDRWISLDVTAVVVPVVVGVLATVVAAWGPARRATRIPPMQALSPVPTTVTRTVGRTRVVAAVVLVAAGTAAMVAAPSLGDDAAGPAIGLGVLGGLVSFAGVLLAAPVFIPALARWAGRLGTRLGGVASELAADNTQRNPRRAAATASALLVGVTLIVTTAVGAASMRASVNAQLDRQFPVSAVVSAGSVEGASTLAGTVGHVPGVERAEVDQSAKNQILVQYDRDADPAKVTTDLTKALPQDGSASIQTSADLRAPFEKALDVMLALAVGLLAISVVIALVGVGNTLGLSVVERTREIGLLRALGLTRSQVRRMFSHEALLLSGVATAAGIALGIGYGVAGTVVLASTSGLHQATTIAIPWWQLGVVVAVALVAAWLASVVPGHRAATVDPSVALVTE